MVKSKKAAKTTSVKKATKVKSVPKVKKAPKVPTVAKPPAKRDESMDSEPGDGPDDTVYDDGEVEIEEEDESMAEADFFADSCPEQN